MPNVLLSMVKMTMQNSGGPPGGKGVGSGGSQGGKGAGGKVGPPSGRSVPVKLLRYKVRFRYKVSIPEARSI